MVLVLVLQVVSDPLWVKVLCGTGLKLKAERLEILEAILKKDVVGCFHFLETVLGKKNHLVGSLKIASP